ncbi:MAG: glycosyltransferase, partial [Pseudomonadales bacterium]|nr:glycosyltransferase [Pseudomonadales bacterium]
MIDALFEPAGGTEGQLLHLLRNLDRARFEPTVFCLHSAGTTVPDAEVLNLPLSPNPATLIKVWNFARRLRKQDFDIVQTHFRDANIIGVFAAWLAGVPTIISTRRGVPLWTSPNDLRLLRWLNGRVSWFIANSQATRDRYVREEGFAADRVDVIYNGLEAHRFTGLSVPERTRLRAELDLAPTDRVVGIVANLRPVKGLGDFLDAAGMLADEFADARFVLVGQGDQESDLRAQAERLDIVERVRFAGARSDVPDLLQCFDVGVLTSHSESFSNSVLEYLAADLPVVVTDVGGVREAVEDGRQGFIVPPKAPDQLAERLRVLLAHPDGPRAWRQDRGL